MRISSISQPKLRWLKAAVPGTLRSTLLNNPLFNKCYCMPILYLLLLDQEWVILLPTTSCIISYVISTGLFMRRYSHLCYIRNSDIVRWWRLGLLTSKRNGPFYSIIKFEKCFMRMMILPNQTKAYGALPSAVHLIMACEVDVFNVGLQRYGKITL